MGTMSLPLRLITAEDSTVYVDDLQHSIPSLLKTEASEFGLPFFEVFGAYSYN